MVKTGAMFLALMVLASSMALAQPRGERGPLEGTRNMRQEIKAKLNLTEAQEKDLKKLRLDLEKKQAQVHSKIQMERLDLKGLLQADNPDRAAIEKTVKAISDLQHQAKLTRIDHWFAVKGVLTPEQQKTWKRELGSFLGERRGPMREMRDRPGMMLRQRMRDCCMPEK